MNTGIKIRRYRYTTAECEALGCRDLIPDSSRKECLAHTRKTGHVTRFLVEDTTKYEPEVTR